MKFHQRKNKVGIFQRKINYALSRAKRFEELAGAYCTGDLSVTSGGFELNDLTFLVNGYYDWLDVEAEMVEEAKELVEMTEDLGLHMMGAKTPQMKFQGEDLKRRTINYFERCAVLERKLYQLMTEHREKRIKEKQSS